MANKIAILMATFNGEKYLKEQLESIINQTNKNFDLFVRDDGSTDNTVSILNEYNNNYTNIHLIKKINDTKGQLANFSNLYKYVTKLNKYDYIMFSDQDDIWMPDKISNSINEIKPYYNNPTLLYTNYMNYDQNTGKKTIAYPKHYDEDFEAIFVQNWLMGCTMVLNRKIIDLINEIPVDVDNHDYWVALVAALHNNIVYLEKITMIHRLHNYNVTTRASKKGFRRKIKRTFTILFNKKYRISKIKMWKNVQHELSVRYSSKHINNLSKILNTNPIKAIKLATNFHYRGLNRLSTISFYVILLLR